MKSSQIHIIVHRNSQGAMPFAEWLNSLKDERGKAQIAMTLDKIQAGNTGPLKQVTGYKDLSEIRIKAKGPGYRLYCIQDGPTLIILLAGGIKTTQSRDLTKAAEEANDYRKQKRNRGSVE